MRQCGIDPTLLFYPDPKVPQSAGLEMNSVLRISGDIQGVGKVLLDFDGTLAYRPGMWRQCVIDVLGEISPNHQVDAGVIRRQLRNACPWHQPERSHLELSDADQWWKNLSPLLLSAFEAGEITLSRRQLALAKVRTHYCDPGRFQLYPDTVDALERLRRHGWEMVICRIMCPNYVRSSMGWALVR